MTPSDVSVSGKAVTLTLPATVTLEQTVTVAYTVPASGRVQDSAGIHAPGFGAGENPVTHKEATAPGAPTNLTAKERHTAVTLTWEAPSVTGGAYITGYEYRYAAGTSVPAAVGWTAVGDITEITVENLTNGTEYAFEVRAANRAGLGTEAAITGTPHYSATGRPGIEGFPRAGQTLTAVIGTIRDRDGLPPTTFPAGYSFQWVRKDGSDPEEDITGEISPTYVLTDADVGTVIKVKVTFTDGIGTVETRKSLKYPRPGTIAEADTAAPVVSSAIVNGEVLVITFDETLAAASGLANDAFTVRKTPSSGSEQDVTLAGAP